MKARSLWLPNVQIPRAMRLFSTFAAESSSCWICRAYLPRQTKAVQIQIIGAPRSISGFATNAHRNLLSSWIKTGRRLWLRPTLSHEMFPNNRVGDQMMNGKVKFRIGDTVYHKSLDLGRGKIRYIYRTELLVAFERAAAGRYAKETLCKTEPNPSADQDLREWLRAA